MNLFNIHPGNQLPLIVNTVIEIPRGSTNKYELDIETGAMHLDRVLHSPLFYPLEYGFIPQTKYIDGDPVDILVFVSHPTFPGCVLEVKPIAVLKMIDDKGQDDKIIGVAVKDPHYAHWSSLSDIHEHYQKEITHFFEVYKHLEQKYVEVVGWEDIEIAHSIIQASLI